LSLIHQHPPHRHFLKKSFSFFGALASTAPATGKVTVKEPGRARVEKQFLSSVAQVTTVAERAGTRGPEPSQVFDAHLHCPSDESGQVWQWYPITRTFPEFVQYLDRTGVQRGIINSVYAASSPRARPTS